ncbi:MAG TPA: hypothetical protein VFP65_18775, partial [Anaeromyxobacteraceae bacterium]|nr:hypothetical protein [Anaeromyxobacteraceae bacterium]
MGSTLGDGRLRYVEVRELERRAASCAALGVDPRRSLSTEGSESPARPAQAVGPLVAAFAAVSPGAGATALAALVAELLAQEGHACGAVDLGSGHLLDRLGADARRALAAGGEGQSAPVTRSGARVVALRCGPGDAPPSLSGAWVRIAAALEGAACIVADVGAGGAPLHAALDTADEVVVVLRPDTPLDGALEAARAWRRAPGFAPLRFLLNGFDPRRATDRAARDALEATLGARLLPFAVHEDAAFAARPAGASLAEHAPESQALHDAAELA